jgi:hypothetical protein
MATVKYTVGGKPTLEELSKIQSIIEAAKRLPYVHDPDCPEPTDEQLAEFHPVNGMTWEERARAMREAGIVDPEPAEEAAADY